MLSAVRLVQACWLCSACWMPFLLVMAARTGLVGMPSAALCRTQQNTAARSAVAAACAEQEDGAHLSASRSNDMRTSGSGSSSGSRDQPACFAMQACLNSSCKQQVMSQAHLGPTNGTTAEPKPVAAMPRQPLALQSMLCLSYRALQHAPRSLWMQRRSLSCSLLPSCRALAAPC